MSTPKQEAPYGSSKHSERVALMRASLNRADEQQALRDDVDELFEARSARGPVSN